MKVRVFVADNHGILRGGLRALLNMQPDMEVVGEAANGPDAEVGIKATEPDVVLMDISMPDGGGLATIAAVKQVRPKTRIIVLTVHDELGYVRAAGQAGAVGYVVKSAVDTELLAAIRAVAQGRTFMDASLDLGLAQNPIRSRAADAQGDAATAQLTGRELEVMRRVAEGFTNSSDRRRAASGRQVGRNLPVPSDGKTGTDVTSGAGALRAGLRRPPARGTSPVGRPMIDHRRLER